jgi:hypothetical protein
VRVWVLVAVAVVALAGCAERSAPPPKEIFIECYSYETIHLQSGVVGEQTLYTIRVPANHNSLAFMISLRAGPRADISVIGPDGLLATWDNDMPGVSGGGQSWGNISPGLYHVIAYADPAAFVDVHIKYATGNGNAMACI